MRKLREIVGLFLGTFLIKLYINKKAINIMNTNYLTQFVEAYELSLSDVSFESIKSREYFESCWAKRNDEQMKKEIQGYIENARDYFEEFKSRKELSSLVKRCHEVSQNFADYICELDKQLDIKRESLFITIGNVKFDGEYLYESDLDSLKKRFQDAIKSKVPMDFHVWITLPDLSIIDMTLHATMLDEEGNDDIKACKLITDFDDSESPFEYEPLLVHNDIMSLID